MLSDYLSAPVSEQVKATLALLEKLTLTPDAVTADDVQAVRAAGVSDQAIEDALHVLAAFNIVDRLADAFDFAIPDAEGFKQGARILLKRGYV